MTSEQSWSYMHLMSGGASHLKEVTIPLAERLEAEFPGGTEHTPLDGKENGPMSMKARYTNTLSTIEMLTGVCVFLGSWGAKRFLDDIYDLKVRPHLRKLLGEKLSPIVQPPANVPAPKKHYCLVLGLWYPAIEKAVFVAAIGEDADELLRNEEAIKQVHLSAERELLLLREDDTILLYVVRENLPLEGLRFRTLEETLGFLALPRPQNEAP